MPNYYDVLLFLDEKCIPTTPSMENDVRVAAYRIGNKDDYSPYPWIKNGVFLECLGDWTFHYREDILEKALEMVLKKRHNSRHLER